MSRKWQWKAGDWVVICDVCAKQIYASESRKRWDGLIVCPDDYEFRHPQDLIRHRVEDISVPFSRPEPTDTFVTVEYVSDYVLSDYVDDNYFGVGD
jgi:hypothetical protein